MEQVSEQQLPEKLNVQHTFLEYIKKEKYGVWVTLLSAAATGLIIIDHENDAISATNRLLLTYPDLHEALNILTEDWIAKHSDTIGKDTICTLSNETDKK